MKRTILFATVATLLAGSGATLQAQIWSAPGGTGSWADAANWKPATVPNRVGASVVFQSPDSTRTISVNSGTAGFTIGSLVSTNDAASSLNTTIANGNVAGSFLTLDASGAGPATITIDGAGVGNTTIAATTLFTDSVVANVNNTTATSAAGALNWTGAVSGGAGGFTKRGAGVLTFGTNAKLYTGPTLLDSDTGRTRISAAGAPTKTSSFTVNPGAQLTLVTDGTYTLGLGSLFLNGTGLGPTSVPGNFPGAIRNETNTLATISNPVVLQTDTLIHVQGVDGVTTLANVVSGPGRLTLTAPNSNADLGTLTLNGANTYLGGTTVNGGNLIVGGSANASLGTGNVIVASGNALFAGASAHLTIQTGVLNAISNTATVALAGGGTAATADDGYLDLGTGVNEVIGILVLGGVIQLEGTYGSSASAATFKNDEYFTGTGILTATIPEPGAASILLAGAFLTAGARRLRRRG
jgi:autotransporter-associated beta strand protein